MEQNYRMIELLNEIKSLIMGQPKEDKWLNIKEASEYCNVNHQTLRRNVKEGKLKASKTLGKLLFKRCDLEAFLNG